MELQGKNERLILLVKAALKSRVGTQIGATHKMNTSGNQLNLGQRPKIADGGRILNRMEGN